MNYQSQALAKVTATLALARQVFGRDFEAPKVTFDLRGKTAGAANYAANHIRLNDVLLRENQETFINRTVPHEVAHLLAFALYGSRISAHGPEWKNVMRRLGETPSRCHTYDTTNATVRRVAKFSMFCACREHQVTALVLGRITRGVKYKCRLCRTFITSQVPTISMGARKTH